MSVLTALRAAGVPVALASAEAPRAEAAMRESGITTQLRAAHFLAQVLHESAGLRYFAEIASGAAYEGRADLGNTRPGDGRRYKGRGPIQLTGRANYRSAGQALHLDLEGHPDLAARHTVGWRIAGWYWRTRGINAMASRDDLVAVTRAINGGTNGLADRARYLHVTRRVDCRPAKPNALAHLTATEERWCRELDTLRKQHRDASRRRVLVRVLTQARKRIWRAAQSNGGWARADRAERYASIKARTT